MNFKHLCHLPICSNVHFLGVISFVPNLNSAMIILSRTCSFTGSNSLHMRVQSIFTFCPMAIMTIRYFLRLIYNKRNIVGRIKLNLWNVWRCFKWRKIHSKAKPEMLNETRHAILGPVTVVYVDDQIIIVCISTSLLDYPKKPFDWDSYCKNTNGRKAPAYLFQPVSIIILRYGFFECCRNVYFIIYSMTLTFSLHVQQEFTSVYSHADVLNVYWNVLCVTAGVHRRRKSLV